MPTASNCAVTACAGNAPRRLPRLDPNHPLEGDNHLPTDERHPGRHQSEWPADMTLESVADIAPEQAADIIGIRSSGLDPELFEAVADCVECEGEQVHGGEHHGEV